MISIISPAKTLDYETPVNVREHTMPVFLDEAENLINILRKKNKKQLMDLMGISEQLAVLNIERFATWHQPFTPENARQAILAFKGEVYTHLHAYDFNLEDHAFAQNHLRILSGLYGILKPLDLIQPYRLEMGTKISVNKRMKNLYQFWQEKVTGLLNKWLSKDDGILVNLASDEYFKALDKKKLNAEIVTPVFKELKGENYKVIAIFAKQARGAMVNFIMKNKISNPDDLKAFEGLGYRWDSRLSTKSELIFSR